MEEDQAIIRISVSTGGQYPASLTPLLYESQFWDFLEGLIQTRFLQAGNVVGQASVISDNLEADGQRKVPAKEWMVNLSKFWTIFFRSQQ